jgi:hypothetical protein
LPLAALIQSAAACSAGSSRHRTSPAVIPVPTARLAPSRPRPRPKNSRRRTRTSRSICRALAPRSSVLHRAGVRRPFRSPRRQTAYDHKRDQDRKKDSKFQRVLHAFLRRPAWGGIKVLRSNPSSLGLSDLSRCSILNRLTLCGCRRFSQTTLGGAHRENSQERHRPVSSIAHGPVICRSRSATRW